MISIVLGLVLFVFNGFIAHVAIESQRRIAGIDFTPKDERAVRWVFAIAGLIVIALGVAQVWFGAFNNSK